jgi:hypothetical protein
MASEIGMQLREAERAFLAAHKAAEDATIGGADKDAIRRANGERDRCEEVVKNRREELRSYNAAMRLEAVRMECDARMVFDDDLPF